MAFVLQAEPAPSVCGEGITRTNDPKATYWKFRVTWPHTTAHIETIRALSEDQAIQFLGRRYPEASGFTLLKDRPKPRLGVGADIKTGQIIPCPKCGKSHKVIAPADKEQKLNFIYCRSVKRFIAVGLEGRYLPQAN